MDKVLVDTKVIQGILSAYHRADKVQSRIYGIILGSKKNNIYHITDAIYGFIFESENSKTGEKELVKMNDETLKSYFNTLTQKFKLNNQNVSSSKTNKEKEIKFQSNDTLMILGGFVTDKEPFNDLYRLHNTLDKISYEVFYNLNKIILLVDPNHKSEKNINYGIKAYEWDTKNIKIKGLEKSNAFIVFKELKTDIVQQLNNLDIIGENGNPNFWEKLYKLKIEKNDKKNIKELLEEEKSGNDSGNSKENSIDFIKKKIKGAIDYLNLFQQFLENMNSDEKYSGDDYNQIALIVSQLEPILNDKEILEVINCDINKKYNVDSLAQLLDAQLTLSDKSACVPITISTEPSAIPSLVWRISLAVESRESIRTLSGNPCILSAKFR